MQDYSNLRVFIDEKFHEIFVNLTGKASDNIEEVPFSKMPDLYICAACVGLKENRFFVSKKRRDIFLADAFNAKYQLPILSVLAYKYKNDIEILNNPKEILKVAEGWANGGIEIVNDAIYHGEGLWPLYRLIDFIENY